MPAKAIRAPAHLSEDTAQWFKSVHADFDLEPHHDKLLGLACEAFDRCRQARETLDRDGLTVPTGDGGLKAHPCIGIERDSRLAFARLLRELDLDAEGPSERARPPALRSNRRGG